MLVYLVLEINRVYRDWSNLPTFFVVGLVQLIVVNVMMWYCEKKLYHVSRGSCEQAHYTSYIWHPLESIRTQPQIHIAKKHLATSFR